MATNVLTYIHNLGRSMVYTTKDALKDMNPAMKSFAEENSDLTRDLMSLVKKGKKTGGPDTKTKILNSEYFGLVKDAKNNFISDIKTGNFYNRERIEQYNNQLMKSMGFDDFDSFDDVTVGEDAASWEQTEEVTVQMDTVGAKIADANAKISLKNAQYISAATKDSVRVLHDDLKQAIHQNNVGLNAINSTLTNMHASNEAVVNILNEGLPKMFEQLSTGQQKTNEILTEILNIQKAAQPKKVERKITEEKDYAYATGYDGIPDLKKYSEIVLKNAKDTIDEMTAGMFSMASSVKDMAGSFGSSPVDMMRQYIASPISSLMTMGVKAVIPNLLKDATEQFNETLKGMFGSFAVKMNQLAEDNMFGNFWLEKIGKIFGIKGGLRNSLYTGNYEKGKVDFDGITRKSIVEVIPSYLSMIVSLLGGPNRRYDYSSGRFIDAKEIRKQREELTASSARSASSDVRSEFSTYLRGINFGSDERRREFDKTLDTFFTKFYESGELFDYNNKSTRELAKKYGVSENDMNLIISMFRLNARNGKGYKNLQLNGNMLRNRSEQNQRIQRMEQQGDSVLLNLFNNSGIIPKLDEKNKDALVNKDLLSPLNVLDNKGHNQFWYLQQYHRAFERVISILGGIYTNGSVRPTGPRGDLPPSGGPDGPTILGPDGMPIIRRNRESETSSDGEVPPNSDRIRQAIYNSTFGMDEDPFSVADYSDEHKARVKAEEERIRKEKEKEEKKKKDQQKKNNDKINKIFGTHFGEDDRAISDEDKITMEDTLSMSDEDAQLYYQRQIQRMVIDQDNIEKEKQKKPNLLQRLRNANSLSVKGMTILESIENIAKAPTKVLANVLHKADERMYQLIYGKDGRADDPDEQSFFRVMMDNLKTQFSKLSDWIDVHILDPLSEKFNSEEMKEGVKNFFKKFGIDLDSISAKLFGEKDEDGVRSGGLFGDIIQDTKEEFKKAWAWVKDSYRTVGEDLFGSDIFDEFRKSDEETLEAVLRREATERASARGRILNKLGITREQIENNFMEDKDTDIESRIIDLERAPKIFDKYKVDSKDLLPFDKVKEYILQSQRSLAENVPDFSSSENVYSDNKIKKLLEDSLIKISKQVLSDGEHGLAITMNQDKAMDYIKRQVDKQIANAASKLYEAQYALNEEKGTNNSTLTQTQIDKLVADIKNGIIPEQESTSEANADDEPVAAMSKGGVVKKTGPVALTKGEMVLGDIPFYGNYFEGTESAGETNASEELKNHKVKFGDRADLKMYAHAVGEELKNFFKAGKEALFGSKDETNKKNFEAMMDDVFANMREYAPKMLVGSVIGGGISLVGGLVGGPLLGAAIGAATGLTMKSQKVQDWLFGEKLNDGSYSGGAFSADVATFIRNKLPNIAKYGAVGAMTAMAPFVPGGPVAGLIVGSGIGFLKNSQKVQNFLFNTDENGNDGLLNMSQKDFTDKVKKALPRMGAGAALGLLAGPFGLMGNIFMGSALGWASTTEKYKNFMFGEEDVNGERHGGLLGTIKEEIIDPIKGYLKDAKDKVVYFVKEKMLQPVLDSIRPVTRFIQVGIQQFFKGITYHVKQMFTEYLGAPINKFLRNKVIKPLSGVIRKVIGLALKPAAYVAGAPFRMIGKAGDAIRRKQIKSGYADYMTAEERVDYRKWNNMGRNDRFAQFDEALAKMSPEDLEYAKNAFAYLNNPNKESKKAAKSARKEINDALFNTEQIGFDNAKRLFELFKNGRFSRMKYVLEGLGGVDEDTKQKLYELIDEQGAIYSDATNKSSRIQDKQKRIEKILKDYGIKDINLGELGNTWKYEDLLKRELKSRGRKDEESTDEKILKNGKEQHHEIVLKMDELISELHAINENTNLTKREEKAEKKERRRTHRLFFGFDENGNLIKPEDKEEESTEEEEVSSYAYGGMVDKTGVAVLSKGEMVIPVEMNPYYNGPIDPKPIQAAKEQAVINRLRASGALKKAKIPYFGNYFLGGVVDKAKAVAENAPTIMSALKGDSSVGEGIDAFSNIRDTFSGNDDGNEEETNTNNTEDNDDNKSLLSKFKDRLKEAKERRTNLDSQDDGQKEESKIGKIVKGLGSTMGAALAAATANNGSGDMQRAKDEEAEENDKVRRGKKSTRETYVGPYGVEQYTEDAAGNKVLDVTDAATRQTQKNKNRVANLMQGIADKINSTAGSADSIRTKLEDGLTSFQRQFGDLAGIIAKAVMAGTAAATLAGSPIGEAAIDAIKDKAKGLIAFAKKFDNYRNDPELTLKGLATNMVGNLPAANVRRILKNLLAGKETDLLYGQKAYDSALAVRNKIVDTTEDVYKKTTRAAKGAVNNVREKVGTKVSGVTHRILDATGISSRANRMQWLNAGGDAGEELAERFTSSNGKTYSAAAVNRMAERLAKASGRSADEILQDVVSGRLPIDDLLDRTSLESLGRRIKNTAAADMAELSQRSNARYMQSYEAAQESTRRLKDKFRNAKNILNENKIANSADDAARTLENSKIGKFLSRLGSYGDMNLHEAAEWARGTGSPHTLGIRTLDNVGNAGLRLERGARNTVRAGRNAYNAFTDDNLFRQFKNILKESNDVFDVMGKSFKAIGNTFKKRTKYIISLIDDVGSFFTKHFANSKTGLLIKDMADAVGVKIRGLQGRVIQKVGKVTGRFGRATGTITDTVNRAGRATSGAIEEVAEATGNVNKAVRGFVDRSLPGFDRRTTKRMNKYVDLESKIRELADQDSPLTRRQRKKLNKLGRKALKNNNKLQRAGAEVMESASEQLRRIVDERAGRYTDEFLDSAGNTVRKAAARRTGVELTEEVAEEAAERVTREATENAAQRAIREGAEETTERIAREAGQEVAERAARETVEEAAERGFRDASDGLLTKLFSKLAGKIPGPVGEALAATIPEITQHAADNVKKLKGGFKAFFFAPPGPQDIPFAIADFMSGWAHAASIFGVLKGSETITTGKRIIAGLVKAVLGLNFFSSLISPNWLVQFFVAKLGKKLGIDVEEIQDQQDEAQKAIQDYNAKVDEEHQIGSIEEYNKEILGELSVFDKISRSDLVQGIKTKIKDALSPMVTFVKDFAAEAHTIWPHLKLKAEQIFNRMKGTEASFEEEKGNGLKVAEDDITGPFKLVMDKALEIVSIPLYLPVRVCAIVAQGFAKYKNKIFSSLSDIGSRLGTQSKLIWSNSFKGNTDFILNVSNSYERSDDSIASMVTQLGTMIQILPATAVSIITGGFHYVKDHLSEIAQKIGNALGAIGNDLVDTLGYAFNGDWKSYFDFKGDDEGGISSIHTIARGAMRILLLPEAAVSAVFGIVVRAVNKAMEKLRDMSGTEEELEQIKQFEHAKGNWTWGDYFKTFDDSDNEGGTASTVVMYTRKITRFIYSPVVLIKRVFYSITEKFGSVGAFIKDGINNILTMLGLKKDPNAKGKGGKDELETSAWDTFEKSGMAKKVMDTVKGVLGFATDVVTSVTQFFTGKITEMKENGTLDKVGTFISNTGKKIADVFANIFGFLGNVASTVVPPIASFIEGVGTFALENIFAGGVEIIAGAADIWSKAITGDLQGVLNSNMTRTSTGDSIGNKIAFAVNGIQGAFAIPVAGVVAAIKGIVKHGGNFVSGLISGVANFAIDVGHTFKYAYNGDFKSYFDFNGSEENGDARSGISTILNMGQRVLLLPFAVPTAIFGFISRKVKALCDSLRNATGTEEEVKEIKKFEQKKGDMTWGSYFGGIFVNNNSGELVSGVQMVTRGASRLLYSPVILVKRIFTSIKTAMAPIGEFITNTIDSIMGFFGFGKDGKEKKDGGGLSAWEKFKNNPVVKGINSILKTIWDVAGTIINGVVGLVSGFIDAGGKLINAVGDAGNWISEKVGQFGDFISGLFGGVSGLSGSGSNLFKDPKGFDKLTTVITERNNSSEEYHRKVLEHLGMIASNSGLTGGASNLNKNTKFAKDEYEGSFLSQRNSRYANTRFNRKGDTERQTIKSDGCAPAVAAMAVNSAAGKLGLNDAADYAINKGYKAKNGGTHVNYFGDIWSNYGMQADYMYGNNNAGNIVNNLQNGNNVVLLGRDKKNRSKSRSPFGPNNHYVLATGVDANGNIIVNDPEANRPGRVYSSKILNNVSMGIAAQAASGSGSRIRRAINRNLPFYGGGALETKTTDLISASEGNYSSVNANDNGALSIGKIQWHAERAWDLAKRVVDKNPSQAQSILFGTNLYSEIANGSREKWHSRKLNSTEKSAMAKLLSTNESKAAQNELVAADVPGYIKTGRSYGLTDEGALMYYADLENQYGKGGAKKFVTAAISRAGSANRVTAEILHNATMGIDSTYADRRSKCYNMILSGNIPSSGVNVDSSSSSISELSRTTGAIGVLAEVDQLINDMASTYIGQLIGMSQSSTGDTSTDINSDGTVNVSTPDEASLGEAIANEGRKYIGGKYVWGGKVLTANGGVDCSGFTWNILKKFGYTGGYMNSAAGAASENYGPKVSSDSIQAGDILFFSKGGSVHHVGIATSNTTMVHAASSKSGIIENNFRNRSDTLACARRYSQSKAGKEYIASHGGGSFEGSGSTTNGAMKLKRRLNKLNNAAYKKNTFADQDNSLNSVLQPNLPKVNLPSPKLPSPPVIKTASGSGLEDYTGSGSNNVNLLAKIKGIGKIDQKQLKQLRKQFKLSDKVNTPYKLRQMILKGYMSKKDKKLSYKKRVKMANAVKRVVKLIDKTNKVINTKSNIGIRESGSLLDSTAIGYAMLNKANDEQFVNLIHNIPNADLEKLPKKFVERYVKIKGLGSYIKTGSDLADYLSEVGVLSNGASLNLPDSEVLRLVKTYNLPSYITNMTQLEAAVPAIVKEWKLSSTIKNASELIDYLSEMGPLSTKGADSIDWDDYNSEMKDSGYNKSGFDWDDYYSEAKSESYNKSGFDLDDYLSEAKDFKSATSGFDWDDYLSEGKNESYTKSGFDAADYASEMKDAGYQKSGFDLDDYNSEAKDSGYTKSGFDWDDYYSEAQTPDSPGKDILDAWKDMESEGRTPEESLAPSTNVQYNEEGEEIYQGPKSTTTAPSTTDILPSIPETNYTTPATIDNSPSTAAMRSYSNTTATATQSMAQDSSNIVQLLNIIVTKLTAITSNTDLLNTVISLLQAISQLNSGSGSGATSGKTSRDLEAKPSKSKNAIVNIGDMTGNGVLQPDAGVQQMLSMLSDIASQ